MGITRAWNLLTSKVMGWVRDFVLLLPNLAVAVLVLAGFWLIAKLAKHLALRLLHRVSHSEQVTRLLSQTIYLVLIAAGFFIAMGILGLEKTVASQRHHPAVPHANARFRRLLCERRRAAARRAGGRGDRAALAGPALIRFLQISPRAESSSFR